MKKKIINLTLLLVLLGVVFFVFSKTKVSTYNKYQNLVTVLNNQKGADYTKKTQLSLTIDNETHILTQNATIIKDRDGQFMENHTLEGIDQNGMSTSFYKNGFYYQKGSGASLAYPLSFKNAQDTILLTEYLQFTERDVASEKVVDLEGESATLYSFTLKEEDYGQKYLTQTVAELLGNGDLLFTQIQNTPLEYEVIVNREDLPVKMEIRTKGVATTASGKSIQAEINVELVYNSFNPPEISFPSDLGSYPVLINYRQIKEIHAAQKFLQQYI